ncbi:phytase [Pisolithus microcarpus]|nr:phytase [Pisolithus microcarpus]
MHVKGSRLPEPLPLFGEPILDCSHANQRRRFLRCASLVVLGVIVSASYFQYGRWHSCPSPPLVFEDVAPVPPEAFQRTWAAYSPYFPAAHYESPPDNCVVTQVNLLQRHGARYPTGGQTIRIQAPLQKLRGVRTYSNASFDFLRYFEWDLGVSDMISLGIQQTFESGIEHYARYRHLISSDRLPFVRASGSDRVIKSAEIWADAISFASNDVYHPETSVILPEVDGANNTLDDSMCPNAHSLTEVPNAWRDTFVPLIAARFNEAAPGADLDAEDVVNLMPLCAFETIFHRATSPFCNLFAFEEFEAHEYYDDLSRYYKTGPGNPLGPIQGVGYVNELLARLTSQPVRDHTQTNSTLDSSPDTFPLNRTFYADFSHDNQMVAIYSALGLFQREDGRAPSAEEMNPGRRWRISRMTPFSARMVVEKLTCDDGSDEEREYVRILVNDAVQPLTFCGAGADGVCALDDFVESQAYARGNGNGDWSKCFELD